MVAILSFQRSTNEGMAMSVAEAMQHGLVCFVTPVGEIKNYALNMQNAVFANIENKSAFEKSLLKIEEIIGDPDRYNEISNHAFQHFQEVEIFSDSLSKAISTLNRL